MATICGWSRSLCLTAACGCSWRIAPSRSGSLPRATRLLRVRAATFDNLFEAISVFASDGRLYLWNRRFRDVWDLEEERLTEHPRVDELVPAMARKLVNPTAAAQIREMVRHTTNERQPANGRISLTDGRHFEFAAVPLPDGNALFTMVDVTDSTRIQEALRERATALEQADRIKTDFVANVSYELRTPLTSIGGFAEMLAGGYAGKLAPAAADYVDAILEAVARLSKLIDDVLALTQGEASVTPMERERIDLAGLCRMAIEAMQATGRREGPEGRSGPGTLRRVRIRGCSSAPGVDRACARQRHRLHGPQGAHPRRSIR